LNQHRTGTQLGHYRVEQRLGALTRGERPRRDPPRQFRFDFGEVEPFAGLLDLPGMGVRGPIALSVQLDARTIGDAQLLSEIVTTSAGT
jgi:hypothetical protein